MAIGLGESGRLQIGRHIFPAPWNMMRRSISSCLLLMLLESFFAGVDGVLPTTFFSPEDGSPFDRTKVDIKGQFEATKPFLERTRDIRLLILRARLLILNKDLGGFALNLAATAYWLEKFWNAVHPRAQAGDSARSVAALRAFERDSRGLNYFAGRSRAVSGV